MKKFVYMIILGCLMCIQSYAADGVKPYSFYEADIQASYDYYSFGAPMPDRTFLMEACSTET